MNEVCTYPHQSARTEYPDVDLTGVDEEIAYLFHSVPEPEPLPRYVHAHGTSQWQTITDEELRKEQERRKLIALGAFFADRYPASEFQVIPKRLR